MKRYVLTLCGAMLLAAFPVMAENRPDRSQIPGPDYGVALTPAVYFVNFLFMYWSNPENAANMPAYRAPIPPQLATCLLDNPEGCRYADYQQYFNGQDVCSDGKGGDKCRWILQCQVEPSTEHLAPPDFHNPHQINKPLGMNHATKLARKLGIDEEIVLTPEEYQCLIGLLANDRLTRTRSTNASMTSPIRTESQTLPFRVMGWPSTIRCGPVSPASEAYARLKRPVFE